MGLETACHNEPPDLLCVIAVFYVIFVFDIIFEFYIYLVYIHSTILKDTATEKPSL